MRSGGRLTCITVTLHHDGDHDHQQHLEEDYSHDDVVHMKSRN